MGIGTAATFSFSTFFKFYLPTSFSCKRRKVGMVLFEPPPSPGPSRADLQARCSAACTRWGAHPSAAPQEQAPKRQLPLGPHGPVIPFQQGRDPQGLGTYPHHQGYLHGWHKGVVGGNFQNPKQTNWGGILLTGCALSVHRTSRNPSFLVFKTGWGGTKQPYHRLLRAKWVIFINA